MKAYHDLHIRRPGSEEELRRIAELARKLGYRTLGCSAGITGGEVDVAKRIDLEPRRGGELLSQLGKTRRSHEVVAVSCLNLDVSRQAARDHRVDLLRYPVDPGLRRKIRFDRQAAELARESGAGLEIDAWSLITAGDALPRLIPLLSREVDVARRFDVPLVITSGAPSTLGLREPRALTAVAGLIGLDEAEAEMAITANPEALLRRNRAKLSPDFVEPGVRRVTRAS